MLGAIIGSLNIPKLSPTKKGKPCNPSKIKGYKVYSSILTHKVGFDFNSFPASFYTFKFSILLIFLLLYFVSELFSTNRVPAQLFVIVCSSGGLQVFGITRRIIAHWLASPLIELYAEKVIFAIGNYMALAPCHLFFE